MPKDSLRDSLSNAVEINSDRDISLHRTLNSSIHSKYVGKL